MLGGRYRRFVSVFACRTTPIKLSLSSQIHIRIPQISKKQVSGDGCGARAMPPPTPTTISAIIQTFRERPSQPARLIRRLIDAAAAPAASSEEPQLSLQILVNDDSGEQADSWKRQLRPWDVYVRSPNVHEVRAYNRLAKLANGSLLVFLQGDECMPPAPTRWLSDAAYIFWRLPRLAVLGGHAGFVDAELVKGFGPYPRRAPVPFVLHVPLRTGAPARRPIAFAHVVGVNIGPYFVRREAFLESGGFTEAYGGEGEPGGHFDVELCMRFWRNSRHSVGLYYGGVGNGVGGHKTRVGPQGRLRRRNQHAALEDLRAQWRAHNATIDAMISSENGQLEAAPPRLAIQLQKERREGQKTCGGK